MIRTVALSLPLFCMSCVSMDAVDLGRHLEETELYLTENPAPEGALPISSIAIEQTGWYLLGLWAVEDISLDECVHMITERATAMGADGVADLTVDYHPPSFFRFSIFPIPDWSASITMTGMAFKMSDPAAAFWKPRPSPSPTVGR